MSSIMQTLLRRENHKEIIGALVMFLTYEKNFKSDRPDGRFLSTTAAYLEMMRNTTPNLELPQDIDKNSFEEWQKSIKEKTAEYLRLQEKSEQPAPIMLSSFQRDGYRVEKWEFYPDDYCVVPFLALIPDSASKDNPVPGIMCFPGTHHSKELLADEPRIDHPNGHSGRFFERNKMAYHYVKAGYAAFAFDNPFFAECSLMTPPECGETHMNLAFGFASNNLAVAGLTYHGVSVFQKLCFMEHLYTLDYIDKDRIAVSGHSLGAQTAALLALFRDDIKAVVYNDFMCNDVNRLLAVTEHEDKLINIINGIHIISGLANSHGYPEICAALAPKYLCINEGGVEEDLDVIRRAYTAAGFTDRLQISYYPCFSDPATRIDYGKLPKYGIDNDEFYEKYSHVDPNDHSFRLEPSLKLLKKCFYGDEE